MRCHLLWAGLALMPLAAVSDALAQASMPSIPVQVQAQAPSGASRQVMLLDTAQSRFGFEVRTRLGQRIEGLFPRFDGRIEVLSDGRHQVRLRMYTRDVQIPDKPRYTAWMRGEEFFDAARYPLVEFDSIPYYPDTVKNGGEIQGRLTIRGISHIETLRVEPAECGRPGYDCDVIALGNIQRGRYQMDNWQLALSDRVTFVLRARLSGVPST